MKDREHLKWVFSQTIKAINAYNRNLPIPNGEITQTVINTNNVEAAKELCAEYHLCEDFLGED